MSILNETLTDAPAVASEEGDSQLRQTNRRHPGSARRWQKRSASVIGKM